MMSLKQIKGQIFFTKQIMPPMPERGLVGNDYKDYILACVFIPMSENTVTSIKNGGVVCQLMMERMFPASEDRHIDNWFSKVRRLNKRAVEKDTEEFVEYLTTYETKNVSYAVFALSDGGLCAPFDIAYSMAPPPVDPDPAPELAHMPTNTAVLAQQEKIQLFCDTLSNTISRRLGRLGDFSFVQMRQVIDPVIQTLKEQLDKLRKG